MRPLKLAVLLALPVLLSGCGFHTLWHDQLLPSGKTIKVMAFDLAWGIEHDERTASNDCFALAYVCADHKADPGVLEQEAKEVFELIRPVSELWGFKTAVLTGYPVAERKGRYEIFTFTRGADGAWSVSRDTAKVWPNG